MVGPCFKRNEVGVASVLLVAASPLALVVVVIVVLPFPAPCTVPLNEAWRQVVGYVGK